MIKVEKCLFLFAKIGCFVYGECSNCIYYVQINPFMGKYIYMYEFAHLLDRNRCRLCFVIVFLEHEIYY